MYSPGKSGQSQAIKKIFMEIEKAANENEYNRTEVQNRKDKLADILNRYRMDLNQTGDVRLLESCDWSTKERSYLNQSRQSNKTQLYRTMNGFRDPKNMIHLQVKGKNQLFKEIEEIQKADFKVLDKEALHRNEETGETEFDHKNEIDRL